MNKKFYITTPIYYPSNKLTIGNSYTTVVCDAIARFHRMLGYDVFFLTGTDEHGQKIAKVAKEKGVSEMEHLNAIVADTKKLWKSLNISYDRSFEQPTQTTLPQLKKYLTNSMKRAKFIKLATLGNIAFLANLFGATDNLLTENVQIAGAMLSTATKNAITLS